MSAPGRKQRVAICSRDAEENYQWLQDELRKKHFEKRVKSVHAVYITNSFSDLRRAISQCDVAILYHTKKRGRINVTDVTDALYDEELKLLHDELGKKNVVVVIDDVDDSNDGEKNRILDTQKSIGQFSCELFLFSENDKRAFMEDGEIPDPRLTALKKILSKGSKDVSSSQRESERNYRGSAKGYQGNQDVTPRATSHAGNTRSRLEATGEDGTDEQRGISFKDFFCCCFIQGERSVSSSRASLANENRRK